uniref:TLDc domain-containing protein n=2 Tax=Palpitomonas bilix TaxID=652834 RepID=A0A7S3FYC8_9EUKA|mmetsp:Transcript_13176/g.34488  ORF Transcript_13176/g.34488 Transcript_13176/m.34488 type:complete len:314 (+) Transcript_13176:685-1626(+)
MNETTLLQTKDKIDFLSRCATSAKRMDASSLLKAAFTIRLPRDLLTPMESLLKASRMKESEEEEVVGVRDDEAWIPSVGHGVYFLPKVDPPSEIIDYAEVERVWSWIPSRLRICDASLAFSTARDGYSISTLFRMMEDVSDFIMLMKVKPLQAKRILAKKGSAPEVKSQWHSINSTGWEDDVGYESSRSDVDSESLFSRDADEMEHVIGCFGTESFRPSQKPFGSGECFVFSLRPNTHHYNWIGLSGDDDAPRDFLTASHSSIHCGGGAEGFALYLDEELHHGASRKSATYGNERLVPTGEFRCLSLEVYKFD